MAEIQLDVPYRSQWDVDAKDHDADCGPTCLAMILGAVGVEATPDGLYRFIGTRSRHAYTTFNELIQAGQQMGLTLVWQRFANRSDALSQLRSNLDAGRPFIALVKYAKWRQRLGNPFSGGHFVVVVGYDDNNVYMHDPLFGKWVDRAKGDRYRMPTNLFLDAWGGFPASENPNFATTIAQTTVPRVGEAAAPAPEGEPEVDTSGLPQDIKRRIRALAAHLRAMPPRFNDPDDVDYWTANLGEYGQTTTPHTVGNGETFASVAGIYYGDASAYRGIKVYNDIDVDWLWVGQQIEIPDLGSTPLPTDFTIDPGAVSFSLTEENMDEAVEYDSFEALNAGFSFAAGLE